MTATGRHNEISTRTYLVLNACTTGCAVPDPRIRLFASIWLHYSPIRRG